MEHKLNAALEVLKRNQKFWIITGVVIALASGIVATGITANSVANSAAESSIMQTKLYLDRVTDAAQTSSLPKEIATAVAAVDKPVFPEVPLGNISESYRMARAFHGEITGKVDTFVQHINSYAELRAFNQKYKELTSALDQLGASNITERYETLKDITALIGQTEAPTDFADKFTEVGRVYTSMERNSEGAMTAQKMGNTEAYEALSKQYDIAAAQIPRVQTDITTYVDEITEKVESLVNDLKRYREEL